MQLFIVKQYKYNVIFIDYSYSSAFPINPWDVKFFSFEVKNWQVAMYQKGYLLISP